MMQFYSNSERESDPYALPDCETLYYSARACREYAEYHPGDSLDPGWYYWHCFPGCLPDSDPFGPFDTEREAIEEARSNGEYLTDRAHSAGSQDAYVGDDGLIYLA